jgi:hypothetical protein
MIGNSIPADVRGTSKRRRASRAGDVRKFASAASASENAIEGFASSADSRIEDFSSLSRVSSQSGFARARNGVIAPL